MSKRDLTNIKMRTTIVLFTFTIGLIGSIREIQANEPIFFIHVLRIDCTSDSEFVANVTCYQKNLNWTVVNNTMEIHLEPGVALNEVFIKMTLFIRNNNMRYVPRYVINTTVDLCAALAGDKSNGAGIIIAAWLKRTSNFYHPCPLSVCLL